MTTFAELKAALYACQGGETIAVEGECGPLVLKQRKYAEPVTLDMRAATVTGEWLLQGCAGLGLRGGLWKARLRLEDTSRLGVTGALLEAGIKALRGSDLAVTRCEFRGGGVAMAGARGTLVSESLFAGMRSDAVQISGGGEHRVIDNDIMGAVHQTGVHGDAVQVFCIDGVPVCDIEVLRNRIMGVTQGVFFKGRFERVYIGHNLLIVGQDAGIYVMGAVVLVLDENDVRAIRRAKNGPEIRLSECAAVEWRGRNTVNGVLRAA